MGVLLRRRVVHREVLGAAPLAVAALEDPRVTAVGLHIEGFDDIETLEHVRLLFDFLPVIAFFVAYKLADIYVATVVLIAATGIQMGIQQMQQMGEMIPKAVTEKLTCWRMRTAHAGQRSRPARHT
mgnify:CR=1 FL=1